jgi:DNA-binding response OmpR family regulator
MWPSAVERSIYVKLVMSWVAMVSAPAVRGRHAIVSGLRWASLKILIVEDDLRLAQSLGWALRRCGYETVHVTTAGEARTSPGDLVLLDLDLPDGDGQELCAWFRARSGVGIVVVSGRATEHDRVSCLRAGADDFVTKPFSVPELLARIEAVLRRAAPQPFGELRFDCLRLDLARHEATVDGEPMSLNRKEFQLLAVLAEAPVQVQSRQRLSSEVWPSSWSSATRTLDVHIARLRTKLGDRIQIEVRRGVGYRLCTAPEDDGQTVTRQGPAVVSR